MNRQECRDRFWEIWNSVCEAWIAIPGIMRWGTLLIITLVIGVVIVAYLFGKVVNFDVDVNIFIEETADPMAEHRGNARKVFQRIGDGLPEFPRF